MFTLLRKVRRSLIGLGKVNQYFLYAIGEITLVVVGILLALQINNWNNIRLELLEEREALLNLQRDFEFNHLVINNVITDSETRIDASLDLIKHCGSNFHPKILPYLDSLIHQIAGTPTYNPQSGFLDDLIGSGKLDIISNDSLRNLLSSWNPLIQWLKNREENNVFWNRKVVDFVNKRGSWIKVDQYIINDESPSKGLVSGFQIDHRDLLNELEFENLADNNLWNMNLLISIQRQVQTRCQSILSQIEHEL